MTGPGYPVVLVVLDGLGDRASEANDGLTPSEAARTPTLDALAATGASGLHVPFGPGRAPSSELAHWALFGFSKVPFCGRAVLEAVGHGWELPHGTVVTHASLRSSRRSDGMIWPTVRPTGSDHLDVEELWEAVGSFDHDGIRVTPRLLDKGQAVLCLEGARSAAVTDTDPLFDHHPWMRPLPLTDADDRREAERTAAALFGYLQWSRSVLEDHPVNERRHKAGQPRLDVVTTKWAGRVMDVPSFRRVVGLSGAIVASGSLYAGLARALDMTFVRDRYSSEPALDIARRVEHARRLIRSGTRFVHVHTKATDEAGHAKDPALKRTVIEELDRGLRGLLDEVEAVVAVTGDHATPSSGSLLHSGDPSPLVVRAPTLRPDPVESFGEAAAAQGWLGSLRASEVLPLLLGFADRPAFLGSTVDPHSPAALVDDPAPMPDL